MGSLDLGQAANFTGQMMEKVEEEMGVRMGTEGPSVRRSGWPGGMV